MDNFMAVFRQVCILFLLMGVGFALNKTKKLTKTVNKYISDIVVTIVAPCVIIQSFERDFDPSMLKNLLLSLAAAVALHTVMIIAVHFTVRGDNEKSTRVLKFAAVFSNAGFVAIPLQSALLGTDGVFCGAAYLAVFNIALWSYGIFEISGDKSLITPKKLLFSPGIIGILIGVAIFITSAKLPYVVDSTLGYISALNVPLPMFLVGYYLADTDILSALKDIKIYFCIILRLLVFPLAGLAVMYLVGLRGIVLTSTVIALSAPVGATASMFSEKFDGDTDLSVKLVSISTLLSIVTMPIVVGIAQLVA